MKKTFRMIGTALICGIAMTAGIAFAACGSEDSDVPDIVTNFTIDAKTGEFSFTGVDGAKSYYIRLYNHVETDDDGNELTLDEKMPVAARRVRARSEQTEYTGTVSFDDLEPGGEYDVYAYTYVKNDDGDLVYSMTDAILITYIATYATPTVDADTVTVSVEDGVVTMTLNDGFFESEYVNTFANYLVNVYNGDNIVASYTVTDDDVETVVEEGEVVDYGTSTVEGDSTETSTASLVLSDISEVDSYSVTVTVISTQTSMYDDSEESDPALLADLEA